MRHLDLLNVFLALQFEQPGYPACLSQHGYLTHSIGVSMRLPSGTTVAPDVLASHPRAALSLLVEVKGGKQLDPDQLARMLEVTPEHLRDVGHLSIPDPGRHRVHVVYFCNDEDREALAAAAGDRHVSVLGFDGQRFRVSGTALPDADFESCLSSARIAPGAPALDLVPYDVESSDGEVARSVLPVLIDMWLAGAGRVNCEDVFARTHYVVRQAMTPTGSGSEKKGVIRRIKAVTSDLVKGPLSPWLEEMRTQPTSWSFLQSVPGPSDRTRELQKIQRAVRSHLEGIEGPQLALPFDDDA